MRANVVVTCVLVCGGVFAGCGLLNAFSTPPPEAAGSCEDLPEGPCRCADDGADVTCVDADAGCVCSDDGKAACSDDATAECVVSGDSSCSTAGCRCEDADGDRTCSCSDGTCVGAAGDDRSESAAGGACRGNCGCDASGCNCNDIDCFANVDGEFCVVDDDCVRVAARVDLSDNECSADDDCSGGAGLVCVEARDGENKCLRTEPCASDDVIDSVAHVEDGVPGADVNVCITPDAKRYRCVDGACAYRD